MSQEYDIFAELLPIFRDEALEKIVVVNRSLMLLEQEGLPPSIRHNATDEVLRIIHTIKGNAASVGLDPLQKFLHNVESSMKKSHREDGLPEGGPIYSIWFRSVDIATEIIEKGYDADLHLKKIEEIEAELAGLVDAKMPDAPGKKPRRSKSKDKQYRDAAVVEPPKADAEAAPVDEIAVSSTSAQTEEKEIIRVSTRRIDRLAEGLSELLTFRLQFERRIFDLKSMHRQNISMNQIGEKKQSLMIVALEKARRDGKIETEAFDELWNIFGDIEKWHKSRKSGDRKLLNNVQKIYREIRQSGISMKSQEESIRHLQMTSVAEMFGSFHRLIRDTALSLNKSINFITEGENVELDRNIIQQLRDPLIHLLRNALDHGIEEPNERESAGKPSRGQVTLRAFASGGGVIIEIEDDGRGMDTDSIRSHAIELGIITAEESESMSERAIQSLVFRAGFSTKKKASLLSGRGVGLDFVRNWVDRLRGRFEWESKSGKGTIIRLRLPLTMATIQALIARIGNQKFAMPIVGIDRVIRVKESELISAKSKPILMLDGAPVEIIPLSKLLGIAASNYAKQKEFPVVISSGADAVRGWVVDELLGEQEIIMKRFSKYIENFANFSGAAIIGNSEVVLVLNTADLHRNSVDGVVLQLSDDSTEQGEIKKSKRVLVVDDSLTTRTLEKLILLKAGYEVTEARDGVEAYETLLKAGDFDLVMTDVQMPRMDGVELTKKIRQEPKFAQLPVIICSFLDREEDKIRGLEAGANAYITKSQFSQNRLLDIIVQLVGD